MDDCERCRYRHEDLPCKVIFVLRELLLLTGALFKGIYPGTKLFTRQVLLKTQIEAPDGQSPSWLLLPVQNHGNRGRLR